MKIWYPSIQIFRRLPGQGTKKGKNYFMNIIISWCTVVYFKSLKVVKNRLKLGCLPWVSRARFREACPNPDSRPRNPEWKYTIKHVPARNTAMRYRWHSERMIRLDKIGITGFAANGTLAEPCIVDEEEAAEGNATWKYGLARLFHFFVPRQTALCRAEKRVEVSQGGGGGGAEKRKGRKMV